MAKKLHTKKVGFLKWESAVEDGRSWYYYYGWTKAGAEKQADEHIDHRSREVT